MRPSHRSLCVQCGNIGVNAQHVAAPVGGEGESGLPCIGDCGASIVKSKDNIVKLIRLAHKKSQAEAWLDLLAASGQANIIAAGT